MKCTVKIDKSVSEDEAIILAKDRSIKINEIESYILSIDNSIYGYKDKEAIKLSLNDIYCFTIEENRVFAVLEKERYMLKQRLYAIEEQLGNTFLKINQSTIINVSKIKKFNASFAGSLMVVLENGYKDFVSRRQLRIVKERIGEKI